MISDNGGDRHHKGYPAVRPPMCAVRDFTDDILKSEMARRKRRRDQEARDAEEMHAEFVREKWPWRRLMFFLCFLPYLVLAYVIKVAPSRTWVEEHHVSLLMIIVSVVFVVFYVRKKWYVEDEFRNRHPGVATKLDRPEDEENEW